MRLPSTGKESFRGLRPRTPREAQLHKSYTSLRGIRQQRRAARSYLYRRLSRLYPAGPIAAILTLDDCAREDAVMQQEGIPLLRTKLDRAAAARPHASARAIVRAGAQPAGDAPAAALRAGRLWEDDLPGDVVPFACRAARDSGGLAGARRGRQRPSALPGLSGRSGGPGAHARKSSADRSDRRRRRDCAHPAGERPGRDRPRRGAGAGRLSSDQRAGGSRCCGLSAGSPAKSATAWRSAAAPTRRSRSRVCGRASN